MKLFVFTIFLSGYLFAGESNPPMFETHPRGIITGKLQKFLKEQSRNLDSMKIQARVNRISEYSGRISKIVERGHFYNKDMENLYFLELKKFSKNKVKLDELKSEVHNSLIKLNAGEEEKKEYLLNPNLWSKSGIILPEGFSETFRGLLAEVRKRREQFKVYDQASFSIPTNLTKQITNPTLAIKKYSVLLGEEMKLVLEKNVSRHGVENGLILPILRYKFLHKNSHNQELGNLALRIFDESENFEDYRDEVVTSIDEFENGLIDSPVQEWGTHELLQRSLSRSIREEINVSSGESEVNRLTMAMGSFQREQMESLRNRLGMNTRSAVDAIPQLHGGCECSGGDEDPNLAQEDDIIAGSQDILETEVQIPAPGGGDSGDELTVGGIDGEFSDAMIAEFIATLGGDQEILENWRRGDETGNGKKLFLANRGFPLKVQTYPVVNFDEQSSNSGIGPLAPSHFQENGELIYPIPDDYL